MPPPTMPHLRTQQSNGPPGLIRVGVQVGVVVGAVPVMAHRRHDVLQPGRGARAVGVAGAGRGTLRLRDSSSSSSSSSSSNSSEGPLRPVPHLWPDADGAGGEEDRGVGLVAGQGSDAAPAALQHADAGVAVVRVMNPIPHEGLQGRGRVRQGCRRGGAGQLEEGRVGLPSTAQHGPAQRALKKLKGCPDVGSNRPASTANWRRPREAMAALLSPKSTAWKRPARRARTQWGQRCGYQHATIGWRLAALPVPPTHRHLGLQTQKTCCLARAAPSSGAPTHSPSTAGKHGTGGGGLRSGRGGVADGQRQRPALQRQRSPPSLTHASVASANRTPKASPAPRSSTSWPSS